MSILSSRRITLNPFDPDQQLPSDLTFRAFWSKSSIELSDEILNQEQIPSTCFPENFFTGNSKDLSFLGVHFTSRTSGVKLQVGVFSSSESLVVLFQYELMVLRVPREAFRYSYSFEDSAERTFRYNETNIVTGTTCKKPGVYVYPHEGFEGEQGSSSEKKATAVIDEVSRPWIPPPNPYLSYDFLFSGASKRNTPETISIGDSSMTVSGNNTLGSFG